MTTLDECMDIALELGETNDCGVRALALVCGIPYQTARLALRTHGRKPCDGVYTFQLDKALTEFCKPKPRRFVYQSNGRQYTPISIAKAYPKGRFLLYSSGHVMAMVDGKILDWADGRRLRIKAIQEVKV